MDAITYTVNQDLAESTISIINGSWAAPASLIVDLICDVCLFGCLIRVCIFSDWLRRAIKSLGLHTTVCATANREVLALIVA